MPNRANAHAVQGNSTSAPRKRRNSRPNGGSGAASSRLTALRSRRSPSARTGVLPSSERSTAFAGGEGRLRRPVVPSGRARNSSAAAHARAFQASRARTGGAKSTGARPKPRARRPARRTSPAAFAGGGGSCAFAKPGFWKSVGAPLKKLVTTAAGRVKNLQDSNEENWGKVSGQHAPLPDMLKLHFPDRSPCPEELILVLTCDFADYEGKVHTGLEFAFNVLHVARQVIVAACEAQTLADEVRSTCPLPFVVMNPVTQEQFDKSDLNTFNEALVAGFRTVPRENLGRAVAKILSKAGWALYATALAAPALEFAGLVDPATVAEFNAFAANASNAFFLASGAVDVVSNFSSEGLTDFALYQASVYGPVAGTMGGMGGTVAWQSYNHVGRNLLASLYSYWESRKQPRAGGGAAQPRRFDVKAAIELAHIEMARAAEMSLEQPPSIYSAEVLDSIRRHCTQLRTTCSAKPATAPSPLPQKRP